VSNEAIYDTEIAPLMQRISEICKKHGIPMLCAFQYDETGISVSVNIPDHLETNNLVDRNGELQWPLISFVGKVVKQHKH
jgi:hypothetical protein